MGGVSLGCGRKPSKTCNRCRTSGKVVLYTTSVAGALILSDWFSFIIHLAGGEVVPEIGTLYLVFLEQGDLS